MFAVVVNEGFLSVLDFTPLFMVVLRVMVLISMRSISLIAFCSDYNYRLSQLTNFSLGQLTVADFRHLPL